MVAMAVAGSELVHHEETGWKVAVAVAVAEGALRHHEHTVWMIPQYRAQIITREAECGYGQIGSKDELSV